METKKEYKEVNGTFYDSRTSDEVIKVLESAKQNRTRIFLEYGDTETGKGWGDYYNVTGTLGRSIGSIKIPLLIFSDYFCVGIFSITTGRVLSST